MAGAAEVRPMGRPYPPSFFRVPAVGEKQEELNGLPSAAAGREQTAGSGTLRSEELAAAHDDYLRFRVAFLVAASAPDVNELELAMIGGDLERAYLRLGTLSGLPQLTFSTVATAALRRHAAHLSNLETRSDFRPAWLAPRQRMRAKA